MQSSSVVMCSSSVAATTSLLYPSSSQMLYRTSNADLRKGVNNFVGDDNLSIDGDDKQKDNSNRYVTDIDYEGKQIIISGQCGAEGNAANMAGSFSSFSAASCFSSLSTSSSSYLPIRRSEHLARSIPHTSVFCFSSSCSNTSSNTLLVPGAIRNLAPKRKAKVILSDAVNYSKDDFMNELLQRTVAWIMFAKGLQIVDCQCLENASSWIGIKIEELGRLAKLYANIRGSATVNYVDMKKAIYIGGGREEYVQIFNRFDDATASQLPREVSKIKRLSSPIYSITDSWLYKSKAEINKYKNINLCNTLNNNSNANASSGGNTNETSNANTNSNNLTNILPNNNDSISCNNHYLATNNNNYNDGNPPPYVHPHMPAFPPEFMYKHTSTYFPTLKTSPSQERQIVEQLLLQMQLPLLQNAQLRSTKADETNCNYNDNSYTYDNIGHDSNKNEEEKKEKKQL